jgi:hypothetical protein
MTHAPKCNETPLNSSTISTAKTHEIADRASGVTLLGSGQRTPWRGYAIDRATWAAILHAEVGPLQALPD